MVLFKEFKESRENVSFRDIRWTLVPGFAQMPDVRHHVAGLHGAMITGKKFLREASTGQLESD